MMRRLVRILLIIPVFLFIGVAGYVVYYNELHPQLVLRKIDPVQLQREIVAFTIYDTTDWNPVDHRDIAVNRPLDHSPAFEDPTLHFSASSAVTSLVYKIENRHPIDSKRVIVHKMYADKIIGTKEFVMPIKAFDLDQSTINTIVHRARYTTKVLMGTPRALGMIRLKTGEVLDCTVYFSGMFSVQGEPGFYEFTGSNYSRWENIMNRHLSKK
ncbi:MAG: hypothetical protein ACM3UZ_03430 [Acidobacteriota bacterium]